MVGGRHTVRNWLKGRSIRKVGNHGSIERGYHYYPFLAEGETVGSELGYTTYKQHRTRSGAP